MSIDTLFWTQIGSILTFVLALFGLYRLLVDQKDATIQLLKEQITSLKDQLTEARSSTPDILARSLHERAKQLEDELKRLYADKSISLDVINSKESELTTAHNQLDELKRQIDLAKELLNDFICPHCGAPMLRRDYASESIEYKGREIDIDHEFSEYDCGYSTLDGEQRTPCTRKNTIQSKA